LFPNPLKENRRTGGAGALLEGFKLAATATRRKKFYRGGEQSRDFFAQRRVAAKKQSLSKKRRHGTSLKKLGGCRAISAGYRTLGKKRGRYSIQTSSGMCSPRKNRVILDGGKKKGILGKQYDYQGLL